MVRLKTRYAGPRGCFKPGDMLNLPEDLEQALVDGKYAERVEEKKKPKEKKVEEVKVERAVVEAPETATAPPARRRRKSTEE